MTVDFLPVIDERFIAGEEVPVSPFCMANVDDWDKVRNVDMDKEVFCFPSHNTLICNFFIKIHPSN